MPESVEKLDIWREGVEIVKAVYALTVDWPRSELYGLTNQVRRAAVSVPANLAEGLGQGTPKQLARYAQIALGSLYELHTLLHLGAELSFSSREGIQALRDRVTSLTKRTSSFIRYQEQRR